MENSTKERLEEIFEVIGMAADNSCYTLIDYGAGALEYEDFINKLWSRVYRIENEAAEVRHILEDYNE